MLVSGIKSYTIHIFILYSNIVLSYQYPSKFLHIVLESTPYLVIKSKFFIRYPKPFLSLVLSFSANTNSVFVSLKYCYFILYYGVICYIIIFCCLVYDSCLYYIPVLFVLSIPFYIFTSYPG